MSYRQGHGRSGQSSCCHLRRRRALVLGNHNAVGYPHESSYVIKLIGYLVRWQAFEKHLTIVRVLDAPIEHDQYTTVGSRPDEPAKPLFEGKSGLGNLIVEESAASAILDCFHARLENGVARHREGKPVDNHATQLLALNVDTLPERRGAKDDRVWRRAELVEKFIPRHGAMQ